MTNKENYFPHGTPIEEINSTLYTDHGFLASPDTLEGKIIEEAYKRIVEKEKGLEPPF